MLITSYDNPKIKEYEKLKQKKYRDRTGTFLVEGMHLVMEAYKHGAIVELILEQEEVLPFAVPTVYVTHDILARLSMMETPPEVMALCRKKDEGPLGKRLLLLDGIQDPGNLGTILRSAAAFAIDSVVLSPTTVDLYNDKVIRSTQGMFFSLNVVRQDLLPLLTTLKEEEIPIYGTQVEHGEDVRYLKNKDKEAFALIMGNEGSGVSLAVKEKCDQFLYIEMSDAVESLNVAVATSILLYELARLDR